MLWAGWLSKTTSYVIQLHEGVFTEYNRACLRLALSQVNY